MRWNREKNRCSLRNNDKIIKPKINDIFILLSNFIINCWFACKIKIKVKIKPSKNKNLIKGTIKSRNLVKIVKLIDILEPAQRKE